MTGYTRFERVPRRRCFAALRTTQMRGTDKHCSRFVDSNSRAGMTDLKAYGITNDFIKTPTKTQEAPILVLHVTA